MSIKTLDTIAHQPTGIQMLWFLMNSWAGQEKPATLVICERGRTHSVMNTIRVALSREWASRGKNPTFELRHSDSIPTVWTRGDVSIEAEMFVLVKSPGRRSTRVAAAFERIMKQRGI